MNVITVHLQHFENTIVFSVCVNIFWPFSILAYIGLRVLVCHKYWINRWNCVSPALAWGQAVTFACIFANTKVMKRHTVFWITWRRSWAFWYCPFWVLWVSLSGLLLSLCGIKQNHIRLSICCDRIIIVFLPVKKVYYTKVTDGTTILKTPNQASENCTLVATGKDTSTEPEGLTFI